MQHRTQSDLENADFKDEFSGITVPAGKVLVWGATVPADASTGYAPGCIFIHIDGVGASDVVFKNVGTKASSNFDTIETS